MAKDKLFKIDYGDKCKDGSHNHIFNRDKDRTPAQKAGDKSRKSQKK
jgi:hypothetical protein